MVWYLSRYLSGVFLPLSVDKVLYLSLEVGVTVLEYLSLFWCGLSRLPAVAKRSGYLW